MHGSNDVKSESVVVTLVKNFVVGFLAEGMILSALLTSVGINLGLCLLFFTLYSILRKQPSNGIIYAPRLFGQRRFEGRVDLNLESLFRSTGWVKRAWKTSEEELLSASGLDAMVFMRIFILSLKVFIFGGIIGIFFILPINFMGNQLNYDFFDLPNKSLDSFSISNVDDGSNRLWVHFCAAYVFTGVVCYLLYNEYIYISSKRVSYFDSSKPQPHQFTVMVRSIPVSAGSSVSDIVENFFKEYHHSTYLSHTVVRPTNKVQELIDEAEKQYRRLAFLKSKKHSQQTFKREGFLGLLGPKVDLLEHYEKKLEDLQDNVSKEQSSLAGKEIPAAFVSFKSRLGAAIALNIQQGIDRTKWVIERAPDPHEVYWPFFSASFGKRWIYNLVVVVACLALSILFSVPVVIVQGLTHLDQLQYWFPFLKGILRLTFISQVITGYLPSLILQLFLFCVPPIKMVLSSIQGYISLSQIQKSACNKVWWFTVWNAFLANILSGTALYPVNVFLELKNIPKVLAHGVPGQASFFISYVVTSGWTSLLSGLFRLMPLIYSFCRWPCSEIDEDFEVPSIPYHEEIPRILFFGLLGITYFFLAPLILPFLLVYYCLGYIIYVNQLLNVYAPKFETGGRLWPIVHNSMIFSLILMHIIALGIFRLKKLPLASNLTIPLPVLTFLFNEFCRKRFLPIFQEYPTECLVKKDSADQNDPMMAKFYEELVTAYQDMPVQYSQSTDRLNSPLLHAVKI